MQNIMKNYFLFAIMVSLFAFSGCNQNTPTNPSGDNDGGNGGSGDISSYPYLTLGDITPLQLLSLSDAETKLTQMGFAGGYTGSANLYEKYTYSKGQDSIFLLLDSTNTVNEVVYLASKGIEPDSAKGWLKHIPDTIKVPANIVQLTGDSEVPFYIASSMRKSAQNYANFLTMVDNLEPEGDVFAEWYLQKPDTFKGYHYSAGISYKYTKNKDRAYLAVAVFKDTNKPEPGQQ